MNLTPQQEAFIQTAPNSGSVALNAKAGSGKTFSLQQWATRSPSSGLATSFSKSTATELGRKMPTKYVSKTLHAIGLAALRSSGKFTKIDDSKCFELTKSIIKEADGEWSSIAPTAKLVDLAKTYGIVPEQYKREGLLLDTPENWEALADQYDLTFTPEILFFAREVLSKSVELSLKDGLTDFGDMLYISSLFPHRFTRYSTVICDEAQDLSALQHHMLSRLLLPNGRLITAGDPNQAIFAFRGALSDSYSTLVDSFLMAEMPLTVSFRCPKAVIREAQKYVPEIESAPSAIEGDVIYHDTLSLNSIPPTVLCRNNAPLVQLALKLLVNGITAEVAGKDIGKGLISLTKRITRKNLASPEFVERLKIWAEKEIARKPQSRPRVEDKVACLTALARANRDLHHIQAHLERLYVNPEDSSRRPAQIHLSTIHRAKGLEWPEVLFLDPQLLPSSFAEQEWELQQENNLAYVGVTRAQKILHYCTSKDIYS